MPIYYIETELGCGIRYAANIKQIMNIEKDVLKERGKRYIEITLVRRATVGDIEWVSEMGGYIPDQLDNEYRQKRNKVEFGQYSKEV